MGIGFSLFNLFDAEHFCHPVNLGNAINLVNFFNSGALGKPICLGYQFVQSNPVGMGNQFDTGCVC